MTDQNISKTPKVKKVSLGSAIIFSAIFFILGVLITSYWPTFAPYLGFNATVEVEHELDWSPLNEVYTNLVTYYDGELDSKSLIEGAKKGMVSSLGDIYTVYMDKEENKAFDDSLHGNVGGGIGIEFGERNGYPTVLRTLPDNPAREAGILAGDIIYKVEGEEVWELDSDTIASKTRGEPGSTLHLTILRSGEEKEFTLTRETINNVSAYYEIKKDTAIITITRFDLDTAGIVENAAKEAVNKNVKKVILDLRNNGGGYLNAARDIVSLWVDGDPVVYQKSSKSPDIVSYASRGKAILKDMKTIVLINASTASASEITAGALRDYHKATILGEKSFGKGVVQTLLDLSGQTSLKVTTASWFTPEGLSINKEGITPDIEVINTYDDINNMRDPQLDRALAL